MHVSLAVAVALFAAPTERPSEPVGGYWDRGERDPEPPDGHERVYTGSILLPLGLLATISGGVSAWVTSPSQCQDLLARYDLSDDECRGLFAFNLAHTAVGGLLTITGAVMLGMGLDQRRKHREWRRRRGLSLTPVAGRTGAGVSLRVRF